MGMLYRDLISRATGVTDVEELDAIEDIMRDSIFHSTLDWQTKEDLEAAAQVAAEVREELRKDP